MKRRTFNTMDLQKEEDAKTAKSVIDEAARAVNEVGKTERKDKVEAKKDKKKRRESKESKRSEKGASDAQDTPAKVDGDTARTESSAKSKKKKTSKDADDKSSSSKKRKRKSELDAESLTVAHLEQDDSTMLGEDWLEGLKTSVGDIGAFFNSQPAPTEPEKKSSKKNDSTKRKSTTSNAADTTVELHEGGPVMSVKDFTVSEVPPAKKHKSKKDKSLTDNNTKLVPEAPPKASPYEHTPKKTPVPLPQQSHYHTPHAVGSIIKPYKAPSRTQSEILVIETPPSQLPRESTTPWKTPIPFPLSKSAVAPKSTAGLFPPASQTTDTSRTPSSAPSFLRRTKKDDIEPSSQDSLTASNLRRYTQPLNDDPKPRPTGRAISVSSTGSLNIKDAIARMGKPSPNTPTSSAEINPFFTPSSRKKATLESHVEASAHAFAKTFAASQATVNFTVEAKYLSEHISWRATNDAAGPLPCLKNATGCTAKSEQVLRLLREEPSHLLKISSVSDAEHAAFDAAVHSSLEAERFLCNAVTARVPVPLGTLDGVYTLYCPKYAATHIDKYGYGQRTLSIARPAGFKGGNTYTARLTIPPSPVACTLLAFKPPPHASLRVTTLTTSAEGYTMGLVCLGNGYVLLRVDMGLLLTGKKSEMGSGDVSMEFVGVREVDARGEGAVKWPAEVKKNVGGGEGKNSKAEEKGDGGDGTPVKKKRGRPTNEERERRALEAAGREG